ncbi:MAG: sugar nucleotide-binding protein, partial [Bacteroidia bacterium]
MRKILITGSNGLLGQKLVYRLRNRKDVECIATARGENRLIEKQGYVFRSMDITDRSQVGSVLSSELPDVIIHTAAMTNVDACELDRENCRKMNVDAVQYLVETLEELK